MLNLKDVLEVIVKKIYSPQTENTTHFNQINVNLYMQCLIWK